MRNLVATLVLIALPIATAAHHSRAEYEEGLTELSGTIERVQWANPHVRIVLAVPDGQGNTESWNLEGQDVSRLDRAGLPNDLVEVGSTVTVAGNVSTRRTNRMFVRNLLRADDLEIVLETNSDPRWPDASRVVGVRYPMIEPSTTEEALSREDFEPNGIFSVWVPRSNNSPPGYASDPPFTDAGRVAYEAFDVVFDNPAQDCVSNGMPRWMTRSGMGAIEFVDHGDTIVIRRTLGGSQREIHLEAVASFDNEIPRPLGYSTGRWEENTLVVTTTRIDWPYLSFYGGFEGAPQSGQTTLTERFHLSEDESTLAYDLISEDPVNFSEPAIADAYYVYEWRPEVELYAPSECIPDFSE